MFLLSRDKSGRRKRDPTNNVNNRWDSSDPERAPPPLPLNPGSSTPKTSPTRPNTSATISAAAQALLERAQRDLTGHYTINPPPERSPERSPNRSPQHKRLQSLQNGDLKEFKSHTGVASEKNESRPSTPPSSRELQLSSPDQSFVRPDSPTPTQESKTEKEKTSRRPLPRPLVRENTPPSATMLALRNMQVPDFDMPLSDITNTTNAQAVQDFERIHSQMKDLTNIANALQKEMTALSKRSRDNATDLMALKKATSGNEEVLEVLCSALDELKSYLGSQITYPAQSNDFSSEALEGLQENLDSLRGDISRINERPGDMTVLYELQENLNSLRGEISRINSRPVEMTVSYELQEILNSLRGDISQMKDRTGDMTV